MKDDDSKVDSFRIIYTDPGQEGRLNIFSYEHMERSKPLKMKEKKQEDPDKQ